MLQPSPVPPVSEATARVLRCAFPKGHPYLTLADTFGTLFTDELFLPLYPPQGHPALAPWRLALVTLLQFAEGLSDRQAAEALLFDALLERFHAHRLLKERGCQRTDATHVQAAVRELNRLEAVGEALRRNGVRPLPITPAVSGGPRSWGDTSARVTSAGCPGGVGRPGL